MRDFLLKDLGWKLLSLMLAAVIWFTVNTLSHDVITPTKRMESWATRTFLSVPVLVVSSAADVREFNVQPAMVQVTVSGRPDAVTALDQKEIHVTVDLTGVEAAQGLRKRVDVSLPTGMKVEDIIPNEVDVVIPPKQKN